MSRRIIFGAFVCCALVSAARAGSVAPPPEYAPHPGLELLLNKPYLPPDFDQDVFDELWKVWEEPLRSQAEKADPAQRRKMALLRYGIDDGASSSGPVLQYTPDGKSGWVMNCLICHGGKVGGKLIPGVPNSHLALQTLIDDVRTTKIRQKKKLTHMDLGSTVIPLGRSNGTTNAVIFGVALGAFRDADLNVHPEYPMQKMVHHDHDAPPWWNVRKKTYLYADGFAPKDHRALMQFLLVHENGPEKFREWESDYKKIFEWIESLRPPVYPWSIDRELAAKGEVAFNRACAECHGTYGPNGSYPNKNVPIAEVGTDPARHQALSRRQREAYSVSWFSDYGKKKAIVDPPGYVAPPLDGVWASAPYFHNGSVPTLWHVLHPEQRPVVWLRTQDGYDREKVGLEVTAMEKVPDDVRRPSDKRRYYDSRLFGKSATGHQFPDQLSNEEKRAVLEYLKTL